MMPVKITNGKRDNMKTTTSMQVRTITKALQGQRCPTREEVIKKLQKERRYGL